MKPAEMAEALRGIVEILETRDFPEGVDLRLGYNTVWVTCEKPEDFGRATLALGTYEKAADESVLRAVRKFGVVDLDVTIDRRTTCKKVVKGTKILPAEPERVETYRTAALPERVVEDVEWECPESFGALAKPAEEPAPAEEVPAEKPAEEIPL